jgi:tRNA 2-thiouridine synthesizing protein A
VSVDQLKSLKVDKVVDARELPCPGPLIEAKRAMSVVPMDGVIEVISSDIATTLDIPAWASKVGHQYLGMVTEPGIWMLFVKRGK